MSRAIPSAAQVVSQQEAAIAALGIINNHTSVNKKLAERGEPPLNPEFTAMSAVDAALGTYQHMMSGVPLDHQPAPPLPEIQELEIELLVQQIFNKFTAFYLSHFRGDGIAISTADQMAFYEIAQPALRNLAVRAQGGSSSGL